MLSANTTTTTGRRVRAAMPVTIGTAGRAAIGAVILVQASLAAPAFAGTPAPALATAEGPRDPVRLTAGATDQLMGELSPNGRDLYYASNAQATWEVYVQELSRGAPRRLFENNADATDPHLSPQGDRLLYISYQTDATGDVCVMELADRSHRCLTAEGASESQAFWFPDGKSVGVVSRKAMHADFKLERVFLNGAPSQVMLDRNLASPALSPDGRWLAYVPVERDSQEVGVSFARRAGRTLELLRLDDSGRAVVVSFDLPGSTGFPAFSRDGAFLYFSQYLNDTNLDGVLDGDDHSVLFRVPFKGDRATPIVPSQADQLTSAEWNCQYPAPAADQLIVTCAHQGSLDIFSLPLEGSIPQGWTRPKLEEELGSSRNHWQKLLLLSRMLRIETERAARIPLLRDVVRLHLELEEYESAEFYVGQMKELAAKGDSGGISAQAGVLLELIGERREERRLSQGRLSTRFVMDQRARVTRLESAVKGQEREVAALALLTVSEIDDVIGDKQGALTALDRIEPAKLSDPFIVDLYGAHAGRLLGELDLRDRQLAAYQTVASHPALPVHDRLRYAQAFVLTLLNGEKKGERQGLVSSWRAKVSDESELALVLDVAHWLLKLTPETQEEVRAGLFELYKKNQDFERRRALVLATVRQAARADQDYLLYEFANSWVSWLKRSYSERRYAEELYRQVLLERAYISQDAKKYGDGRGYFYGLTLQVDSLEAHAGFIEARLLEGKNDVEAAYAKRYQADPGNPVNQFVQAYLIARKMPELDDSAHAAAVKSALGYLQAAGEALPRSLEVQHVWGYVAHQRYLRTGDNSAALEANTHYLLALDLARANPRFQAPLLEALGLLQAGVGSHRAALDYFAQRAQLPFRRADERLCLQVARARSLFHVGQEGEAADEAALALKSVELDATLAKYRPLVLQRAALYSYIAGRYEQAWKDYEALTPLLAGDEKSLEGRRRLFALELGKGLVAQKLGRHEVALEAFAAVNRRLGDTRLLTSAEQKASPDKSESGQKASPERKASEQESPTDRKPSGQKPSDQKPSNQEASAELEAASTGAGYEFGQADYRLLLAGLEAHSQRALNRLDQATTSMQQRRELLEKRLKSADADADVLELAGVHHHLGEYAWRAGKIATAQKEIEAGLGYARLYRKRTGGTMSPANLQLLQDYAELHLYGKVPLEKLAFDLKIELLEAYDFICRNPSPRWAGARFLFEQYLTALELEVRGA